MFLIRDTHLYYTRLVSKKQSINEHILLHTKPSSFNLYT